MHWLSFRNTTDQLTAVYEYLSAVPAFRVPMRMNHRTAASHRAERSDHGWPGCGGPATLFPTALAHPLQFEWLISENDPPLESIRSRRRVPGICGGVPLPCSEGRPDLSRLIGLFFLLGPCLSLLELLYPFHKCPPKANRTHDNQHV